MNSRCYAGIRLPLMSVMLVLILFELAVFDSSLAWGQEKPDGPVLKIKFQQILESVVVPINVNGSRPLNCILDTGMPEGLFLMRPTVARDCNLNFSVTANVQGAGAGSQMADVDLNAKLQLGSLEWERQRVIVLQQPGRLAHIGVDGAFGQTVFQNHVVQLDFDRSRMSVFLPGQLDQQKLGESVAATIRNTKLFIGATIDVDGKKRDVELLVDTGANGGLSINPTSSGKPVAPKPVISTYLGAGVGGDIKGSIGRIETLEIGDIVLGNVATAFPEARGVDGDGSIGMELLRKFLVTIDYPNKRIYLKPNSTFNDPTEFTMTGLAIAPDDTGKLVVRAVLEDSPAAKAGVVEGDTILQLNGNRLSFADFSRLELDEPGQKVELLIERDGKKRGISLLLRRLR